MLVELFYMDTVIWCKTPYIKDFISALKDKIHKEYRYWDKDERVWVINYAYEAELIALCSKYYSNIARYGEKRYNNTTAPKAITSSPAYQTLFLMPNAPKEVVLAVYRVLAKLYHPDTNKSPDANDKMKKVNIAFDEIMGRR